MIEWRSLWLLLWLVSSLPLMRRFIVVPRLMARRSMRFVSMVYSFVVTTMTVPLAIFVAAMTVVTTAITRVSSIVIAVVVQQHHRIIVVVAAAGRATAVTGGTRGRRL